MYHIKQEGLLEDKLKYWGALPGSMAWRIAKKISHGHHLKQVGDQPAETWKNWTSSTGNLRPRPTGRGHLRRKLGWEKAQQQIREVIASID